jgi:thiol-disulfide isomerase/thioredoxin
VSYRKLLAAAVACALAMGVLAGCSSDPTLAAGNGTGYVSGNGEYKEVPPADRKAPTAPFSATLETGGTITSAQYSGKVHVLNFWYSNCGPCRVEAPRLEAAYTHYKGSIPFLGVNVYDQSAQAIQFEKTHGITYPSVIDTNNVTVQYAYSAYVSPDAVPVTLVIDKHGRVAARITGVLETPSILEDLISRVVSEGQ